MNKPVNKRAVGVGLFIIIGLLFLVGGVLTIGDLHSTFQKKMTVSTIFGDVNGLQSGNNIWFSGVKIGTVKKTQFYGDRQVRVIMN
ncbi:MAG: MlaD family protein, partial [Bacteroidia bacterium]